MKKVVFVICGLTSLLNVISIISLWRIKIKCAKPYLGSLADGTMRRFQEAAERGELSGFKPEDFDFDFSYLDED